MVQAEDMAGTTRPAEVGRVSASAARMHVPLCVDCRGPGRRRQ